LSKLYINAIDHWSGRSGVKSTEACRIALAFVYLIMNFRNDLGSAADLRSGYPVENYTPDGILMLLGPAMPSDGLIDAMILLSKIFPWFLLLGVFSRVSLWGTLLTHLFLRTLVESFSSGWSHGFNVVFLAHIAFLFAPVGQYWSVDAWVRKRRNRPLTSIKNGFWAVVLGQCAVALMFASAFYWKALYNVRAPFSWAHWENMRNQLLYRYEWCGDPVPDFLEPMIQDPLVCGLLAWSNLLFQIMPILAVFFLNRPVLRLLLGLGFVVEELGLAVIMGLADLHWLPLIAFFVDWDHFLRSGTPVVQATTRYIHWKSGYAIGFVLIYLLFSLNVTGIAFGHNVYDLRAYPFSQFSMYSGYFRSKIPGTFAYPGTTFKVEEGNLSSEERQKVERILKRRFYGAYFMEPEEARGILDQALQWANDPERTGLSDRSVEQLAMFRTLHLFRKDTVHLANGATGLIGRISTAGTCVVSARFLRTAPDSSSIILTDECGTHTVTGVMVTDNTGIPHTVPFQFHGTEMRVALSDLHGKDHIQLIRKDSLGGEGDALLFRIVGTD